jgi:hypothetical protein
MANLTSTTATTIPAAHAPRRALAFLPTTAANAPAITHTSDSTPPMALSVDAPSLQASQISGRS